MQPVQGGAGNKRLAKKHLCKNRAPLVTLLCLPGIDATNRRADDAMLYCVILREA
jgi:hypothetical protein